MPSPEIEEFAKLLVKYVRDESIKRNDRVLDAQHVVAKRWQNASRHGDVKAISKILIPDIVDDTIFHLLHAIDQGLLELTFKAPNGKVVKLSEDGLGELAGWYMGSSDGWRGVYSKERFVDDFSDLK
jgi:hypothetical protein